MYHGDEEIELDDNHLLFEYVIVLFMQSYIFFLLVLNFYRNIVLSNYLSLEKRTLLGMIVAHILADVGLSHGKCLSMYMDKDVYILIRLCRA